MTLAKAKDYFSAYYEGSLDRGLKQAFETRIKEDAQLQAEYRAFTRAMKELEAFGSIDIEPPADLHDKIAARLDKAIWEQKRQKAPTFSFAWWQGLVAVTVAAACVIGFVTYSDHQRQTSTASLLPVGGSSLPAKFTFAASGPSGHGVALNFPGEDAKLVVKDSDGKVISSVDLNGQEVREKPLENTSDTAQLIGIEADTPDGPIAASFVAVPGRLRDPSASGKGAVKDLATAIAGHYQKPVVIQNQADGEKPASWDLTTNDLLGAATASLKGLGLSISEEGSGIILIQPNN